MSTRGWGRPPPGKSKQHIIFP